MTWAHYQQLCAHLNIKATKRNWRQFNEGELRELQATIRKDRKQRKRKAKP